MRLGIRTQLLLALTALLVMAFVPLFIAVAGLTRSTMQQARLRGAKALGRAVAAHVGEARSSRGDGHLTELLRAEIGGAGLTAIGLYDQSGKLVVRQGSKLDVAVLPARVPAHVERTRTVKGPKGQLLEVLVPTGQGPVVALLRMDEDATHVGPLLSLVGLYVGIFALALLVFTYIALTRLIVRPIVALSTATRRVAQGARTLNVPIVGPRELAELSQDVAQMTKALRAEEQALRDKVQQLEQMTEELWQAQRTLIRSERLASVGRLAAGLAHEIGNPISAILGLQQLLLEEPFEEEERRDFLLRMKTETERIHRVLRQLLDFARPAGTSSEGPGSCRIEDAVTEASNLVRPQKNFRDIGLHVSVPKGLPKVLISQDHLAQVLINLLLNAADAMGGEGNVWVRAEAREQQVVLVVEDDGPGIPPEILDKIFEPFFTTKEVGKGTGLGLAVCRGLVEDSGGTMKVTNRKEGSGARFEIVLQVERKDEEPSGPDSHQESGSE